jgi:vancomycin resistance protein YoaR
MLLVFLLIVVQGVLAITTGVLAFHFSSQSKLPAGIVAGNISVGGMDYEHAAKLIESSYSEQLGKKPLRIQIQNGISFEIPFTQIDAKVDGYATVQSFKSFNGSWGIPQLISTCFSYRKSVLKPVIKINEGNLRQALLDRIEQINKAPVNAVIAYKNGIIVKKSETDGISLDVANAAEVVKRQLAEDPMATVLFRTSKNYELKTVLPPVRLRDYNDIQQVLSEYSTDIQDKELSDGITLAVNSINGALLPAAAGSVHEDGFSFIQRIKRNNVEFENDNERYDQVASTLYAAVLLAGVPVDNITRLQHKLATDYIEPGLDAWISGNAGDLKFTNPFSHDIAILAQADGNRVTVIIAGSIAQKKAKVDLQTEITQKIKPAVYNEVSNELKTGERIVLSPGKEGVVVKVLRNGQVIDTDTYDAEKSIVQIGPGTAWQNDEK